MRLGGFFSLAWLFQLLVGVTLFGVSFAIEAQILQAFLVGPALALVLALGLEVGKAVSIIWHRYLAAAGSSAYPKGTRVISGAFRAGLVILSLICSLLYLGAQMDRPNLETVRRTELDAIDRGFKEDIARLENQRAARLDADQVRRNREYADTRTDHRRQLDQLEALLRAEMNNVVKGVFRGPRYETLEQRLAAARSERDAALLVLAARHRAEAARLGAELDTEYAKSRAAIVQKAETARRSLHADRLDSDERIQDPRVVALIRMFEAVLGLKMNAPQFVFLFAVFISIVIELGIVLAFDIVTLSVLPALEAQHREGVTTEAMMAEMQGTAEREGLRHRESVERIRRGADRIHQRAETLSEVCDTGNSSLRAA